MAVRIYASNRTRWGFALVRSAPWLAAAALLIGVIGTGSTWIAERLAIARLPAVAASAPNVLLIVMDTQRADHLTAYGYSRATTPRLGRLADEDRVHGPTRCRYDAAVSFQHDDRTTGR